MLFMDVQQDPKYTSAGELSEDAVLNVSRIFLAISKLENC